MLACSLSAELEPLLCAACSISKRRSPDSSRNPRLGHAVTRPASRPERARSGEQDESAEGPLLLPSPGPSLVPIRVLWSRSHRHRARCLCGVEGPLVCPSRRRRHCPHTLFRCCDSQTCRRVVSRRDSQRRSPRSGNARAGRPTPGNALRQPGTLPMPRQGRHSQ